MNIHTSKIALTKVILDIENPKLIEEITQLIQSKSTLTNKQELAIDVAIHSLENNHSIAHDMVKEETKIRYSKYFK